MHDPVFYDGKIRVTPSLTESEANVLLLVVGHQKTMETQPIIDAIEADPDAGIPYYGDLFEVVEDGMYIVPEGEQSRPGVRMWLRSLIPHFFMPRGYSLNGEIKWGSSEERGCIYVKDNQIDAIEDLIVNPGPKWAPLFYADDQLKKIIKHLVESADNTGCSPDLTVVSAECLRVLMDIYKRLNSADSDCGDPEINEVAAVECDYCRVIFEHTGQKHCPIHQAPSEPIVTTEIRALT